MKLADIEMPCDHDPDDYIGRVEAGDPQSPGPYASAYTCAEHLVRTEGWAQYLTGQRTRFVEGVPGGAR